MLNSDQLHKLGDFGVAYIKVQSKRIALLKRTRCKRGTGVEVRRGVAVNERPIARGEVIARVLDGGGGASQ